MLDHIILTVSDVERSLAGCPIFGASFAPKVGIRALRQRSAHELSSKNSNWNFPAGHHLWFSARIAFRP
jgi:hypothetical protein